jgi:hypothetical protein
MEILHPPYFASTIPSGGLCQGGGLFHIPIHCQVSIWEIVKHLHTLDFNARVLYPMSLHFTWTSGYIECDFEDGNGKLWYIPLGKDTTFLNIGGDRWDLGATQLLVWKRT